MVDDCCGFGRGWVRSFYPSMQPFTRSFSLTSRTEAPPEAKPAHEAIAPVLLGRQQLLLHQHHRGGGRGGAEGVAAGGDCDGGGPTGGAPAVTAGAAAPGGRAVVAAVVVVVAVERGAAEVEDDGGHAAVPAQLAQLEQFKARAQGALELCLGDRG